MQPFALPNSDTFSGMYNYVNGIPKTGLLVAAGRSAFITICSVIVIVLLTSMAAWWITRSYMQIIHSIVLSVCICNDRSISDGYVYTV